MIAERTARASEGRRSARRRDARDAGRPEPTALAWARLVLRPEVLPRATLGQVLLARRLAGA